MRLLIIALASLLIVAGVGTGLVVQSQQATPNDASIEAPADPEATTVFAGDVHVNRRGGEATFDALVPATAESLRITATWRDSVLDIYNGMNVSVRTAESQRPQPIGPIRAGETMTVSVTRDNVDRPSQVASAWSIIFDPQPLSGVLAFNQDIDVEVVAQGNVVRQLTGGADAAADLLDVHGVVTHAQLRGELNNGWLGAPGVIERFVLPDGLRVANDVQAVLELNAHPHLLGAFQLGIKDASNKWTWLSPSASQGRFVTFTATMDDFHADAPDIPSSQWHVALRTTETFGMGQLELEGGYNVANYRLTVSQ